MNAKQNPSKLSRRARFNFSADYRSHFEEMRDSSVATKSRVGISKGTGLATEALSLLMLLHDTMQLPGKGVERPLKYCMIHAKKDYKDEVFVCIPTLGSVEFFKNFIFSDKKIKKIRINGYAE